MTINDTLRCAYSQVKLVRTVQTHLAMTWNYQIQNMWLFVVSYCNYSHLNRAPNLTFVRLSANIIYFSHIINSYFQNFSLCKSGITGSKVRSRIRLGLCPIFSKTIFFFVSNSLWASILNQFCRQYQKVNVISAYLLKQIIFCRLCNWKLSPPLSDRSLQIDLHKPPFGLRYAFQIKW